MARPIDPTLETLTLYPYPTDDATWPGPEVIPTGTPAPSWWMVEPLGECSCGELACDITDRIAYHGFYRWMLPANWAAHEVSGGAGAPAQTRWTVIDAEGKRHGVETEG